MDSDEITSNSGCSKAPSGGRGRVRQFVYSSVFYYVNISLYLQPGVKTGHYFPPQKDRILPVQLKKNHARQKCCGSYTISSIMGSN